MAGSFSVGGIVSGLDTTALIASLMQVERRPLDQLQTRQSALQQRKTAFDSLNTRVGTLNEQLAKLRDAKTYQARATVSGDPKIVTASAGANTAVQSFSLNVTQLATRTIVTGLSQIGAAVGGTTVLSEATRFAVAPTAGTFTLSVGGASRSFSVATTDTLQSVLDRVNATDGSGFGAGFATLSGNHITLASGGAPIVLGAGADTSTFLGAMKLSAAPGGATGTVISTGPVGNASSGATLSSANLATSPGTAGAFAVNGVRIDWTDTESIAGIISRINGASAGVAASYDMQTDKITVQAKGTGATAISFQQISGGDLLGALGISGAPQTLGKNAQYDLGDGVQRYSTSNAIADAVTGVGLTLAGQGSTTVGVTQDTGATLKAMRAFVDTYNAVSDFIGQQTAYDATSKSAARFAGNSLFRSLDAELRRVVTTPAAGLTTYQSLPEIGISTGAFGAAASTSKRLVLDETKFVAAMQQNQQAVTDLLTTPGGPVATLQSYLGKLTDTTGILGSGTNSAASMAGKEIARLGTQMVSFQARLDKRSASLTGQFTALERTMARLQAQSATLTSQLASLSSAFSK